MDKSLKANCIGEFLGTALLIFFGVGCVAALKVAGASFGLWEISIMWGMGVALAVYATAGLSGAHLNPAVTIALWKFACFDGKRPLAVGSSSLLVINVLYMYPFQRFQVVVYFAPYYRFLGIGSHQSSP